MSDLTRCLTCRHVEVELCAEPCKSCSPPYSNWEERGEAIAGDPVHAPGAIVTCAVPPVPVDSKIAAASKKSEPFRRALTEVWRVALFGEGKHGANNWQSALPEGMHYYEDAHWRHTQLRRMGYVFDDESHLRHLAHAAWCALMILEMELRGVVSDEWCPPPEKP